MTGDRFQMRLRVKRIRGLAARLPPRTLQRALLPRRQTRPLPRPPLSRGGEGRHGRHVPREERRRDRLQEGRGRSQGIGVVVVRHIAAHASKENTFLNAKDDDAEGGTSLSIRRVMSPKYWTCCVQSRPRVATFASPLCWTNLSRSFTSTSRRSTRSLRAAGTIFHCHGEDFEPSHHHHHPTSQ